jgi:Aspartyl/Asparaginyl beta-hydroxylase
MRAASSFIQSIADVNFHGRGPKTLRLFKLEEHFFAQLRAELEQLTRRHSPSQVGDYGHVTNWTQPFGEAVQFSLLNTSGKLDDPSTDHNLSLRNKSFHHGADFPQLAHFISAFPHALNMRLNGMGKKSGLSPHEENVIHWCGPKRPTRFFARVRFHLPMQTKAQAQLLMDGETFHFEAGYIYFFHNGTVHSANNLGDTYRYHLVWDMLLTRETYAQMFQGNTHVDFLQPVPAPEREVPATGKIAIGDYAISGLGLYMYRKLRLERLGVRPSQFHSKVFDPVARQVPLRLDYAEER